MASAETAEQENAGYTIQSGMIVRKNITFEPVLSSDCASKHNEFALKLLLHKLYIYLIFSSSSDDVILTNFKCHEGLRSV